MQDLDSLLALLAQAERRRDLALADEAAARTAHQAASAKVDELVDYRRSYEQRWSSAFCGDGNSGAIELVRCYQGFVERLTQAIEHQRRAAHVAESRLMAATVELRELEIRAAAMKKLLERRTKELLVAADRREQRQSDEHSARVAWERQVTVSHTIV
jgi:flagellar FliJ protein